MDQQIKDLIESAQSVVRVSDALQGVVPSAAIESLDLALKRVPAPLIIAAPELLAAAKTLLGTLGVLGRVTEATIISLQQAVNKAEGN